jgi:ketosteroid isomerase-like protein
VSRKNIEIVRGIYEAFARTDIQSAFEAIDPEVVWDLTNHSWPGADQYHGHEGIVEVLSEWIGSFEEYRIEPEQFLDAGDQVVVVQHEVGRHRGSDMPLDRRSASVYTLREGKATRIDHYLDVAKGIEAAGLST